jgi:LytS/YehU family sensor histidine kinase/ligand-binding sensor domain-containing protein
MRYVLVTVIIFIYTGFANPAKAQQPFNYPFRYITQADGLLHNEVLYFAQDRKGFIWIASRNGLQRYDGVNFIHYPEVMNSFAQGIKYVSEMYADKTNDLLWISNYYSIQKMELDKNNLTFYDHEKLLNNTPFTAYRGENKEYGISENKGVYIYDSITKKNTFLGLTILPKNNAQTSLIVTDSTGNNTWVSNGSSLLLFDKRANSVYSNNFNADHHPLLKHLSEVRGGNLFRYSMIDSRQNIWVTAFGDRFYKYDSKTKKISTYSLSAIKMKESGSRIVAAIPVINCILEDNNHIIWIGTENAGLLRYNQEKDNFDYCIVQENNSEGIRYNYNIYSLFQDKEQNIWIGTDKGICIFNPYRQYYKSIRHQENNPSSISKSGIQSCIQTANGDIFIGTYGGGIGVYDKNVNFKKNIHLEGLYEKNFIWSFQQVNDKTLWIGCQHGYLLVYNLITGATQTLRPPELKGYTIRCMEKDIAGNIWLGLHNGDIAKWDTKLNKFFAYGTGLKDSLKNVYSVINIFIDKSQHCWVSTVFGFKEFDLEKRQFTNTWLPDKNNSNSVSASYFNGIEELNDSTLAIGTVYGGLNLFNKRTKTFSHVTTADGLPSNTIYAVKKDTAGYIWFTTDYGLYKFNPANNKFIPYSIDAGLIKSSFTANHFYPLQDGQWLTFTGTEAISFFPYKAAYSGNLTPKIEITGFKLFNKSVFIDSLLTENKPLRLSYKENFFSIEFAALNFSGVQQTNYYYRLTGIDKGWVNNGTKRFASYTDLKPGEYTFEVKAEQGDSSGEITSFKIIITPPFWKTSWFITLISCSILLLAFLFIRGREKSFKAIAAEKLKVQQLNAEQYKSKLELEQIINYFSSSLVDKNKMDEVLWDVAKNLIGRIGFVDCMIYLWNTDKSKMIQKAGFGPKGSVEEINKQLFDVLPGQGVVGYVMQTREAVLIPDTSKDSRYRPDEMTRLSEISVPVMHNNELLGVIDCEHHEKNYFSTQHLQILNTIATLMANKIKSIEAEQLQQQTDIEMYSINEQLLKAKLEALRSQMNPHFIFNSLNSIDNLIQTNQKDKATTYLARFAKLIRNVLDSSKNDVVAFQKDYETLELYLQMEKFRCNDKFTYQLSAEEDLLHSDYKVLPLVVQPFVENAIHHGLLNKLNDDRKLTVSATLENDYIKYIICDNGVGRARAQQLKELNKPEHQSYGIDITRERIQLYNQSGENNDVTITDLFENNEAAGTKVEIKVKIF